MAILKKYQNPAGPIKAADGVEPTSNSNADTLAFLKRMDYQQSGSSKLPGKSFWKLSPYQAQMVAKAHNAKIYKDASGNYIVSSLGDVSGGGTGDMYRRDDRGVNMKDQTTYQTQDVKAMPSGKDVRSVATTTKGGYDPNKGLGLRQWNPAGGENRLGGWESVPKGSFSKDFEMLPTGNVSQFQSSVLGVYDAEGNPIENYDFSGVSATSKKKSGGLLYKGK